MNHSRSHISSRRMIAVAVAAGFLAARPSPNNPAAAEAAAGTVTAPTTTVEPQATAASAATEPTTALAQQIQGIVDGALAPGAIAWNCCGADAPPTGASLAVRIPGRADIVLASGTNLDGTAFDGHDPFNGGSLTQSLTATVGWQLVDEGVLDPAATVDQWRGDLPNAAQVTVDDLLQGTHGWADFEGLEPDFAADLERRWTLPEVLEIVAQIPPAREPGTYGPGGEAPASAALAYILEQVTGSTLDDLVATRVADPLGLDDTLITDGTPEPAGSQDGMFVLPGGTSAVDTSMFPHTAYRTFYAAQSSAATTLTDLLDLIDGWAAGTLFTTDRSASPERFVASRPIFEPAPGEFSYTGVVGDGIPFNGYCPCQVEGDLAAVTAVGRTPRDLGTDIFAVHYLADDITVVLHFNSSEATDRNEIRAIVDAIHAAAASSM